MIRAGTETDCCELKEVIDVSQCLFFSACRHGCHVCMCFYTLSLCVCVCVCVCVHVHIIMCLFLSLSVCVLQTDTADKPLTVHVFHSAVVAHQSCALHCLNLLKELAEKSAAFRRLISTALVQKAGASTSVLDECFLNDSQLWISKPHTVCL